jgi:hypothetical protein
MFVPASVIELARLTERSELQPQANLQFEPKRGRKMAKRKP